LYHLFLKYLYLNLRETAVNLNSTANNISNITSGNQINNSNSNLVWRQFKGRLYTRLHDKRITELDLNGMLNVAYLFFVIIRCFSNSASLNTNALKSEQIENYFRILNIFLKSKNLQKIDQILPNVTNNQNSASSNMLLIKSNAINEIFNTKFVALKLWFFDANDFSTLDSLSLGEEADAILKQEFINIVNNWLEEANKILFESTQNQINAFKNSQLINQFLSDVMISYIENCRNLLQSFDESNGIQIAITFSSQLVLVSSILLSKFF
jgi:hypothetical protein